MPGGGPTKYSKDFCEKALKLSEYGLTDSQMAEFFGVSIPTFNAWKGKHPEFLKSLKVGKEHSDDLVERSLYERAVGYDYHEDKIFQNNGEPVIVPTTKHMPGDVGAAKMWLTNRRRETWSERKVMEHDPSEKFTRIIEALDRMEADAGDPGATGAESGTPESKHIRH